MQGHPAPRREAGERVAVCPTLRAGGNRTGGDRPPGTDVDTAESLIVARCVTTGEGKRQDAETCTPVPVAFAHQQGGSIDLHISQDCALAVQRCQQQAVLTQGVRRLTPREAERLQGFPDDWTLVPYRRGMAADGPRYKAIGNSMAVPVVRWIGERIARVEAGRA